MIKLKQPNLVVNSHDVGIPKYKMYVSVDAPRGLDANGLLNHIVRANRLALENQQSQLLNIVLNSHGYKGFLAIGGHGMPYLDIGNINALSPLKGKNIGTIWLTSCSAAGDIKGKMFCLALARVTGCQVVASDSDQHVGDWDGWRVRHGAPGLIDEFEGSVYRFTPAGGFEWIDPHAAIYTILE